MPILNKIFPIAFGRVDKNRKAASERGWYPPNRKLLDHPELEKAKKIPSQGDVQVNTDNGMGASVLDTIIQQRLRTAGIEEASRKRKEEGKSIQQRLKEAKKVTSGVLNSVQISNLDHPEFVKYLQTKKQEEEAKAKYDEVKKKRQITDLVTKIATIH